MTGFQISKRLKELIRTYLKINSLPLAPSPCGRGQGGGGKCNKISD
jgi:hypothetical protein